MKYLICLFLVVFYCDNLHAFDNKDTHPRLSEAAAKKSNIETYLISTLGYTNGLDSAIASSGSILSILKLGSNLEDVPACRASNHFHNPLLPWDQSQMSDDPWWLSMSTTCSDFVPRYSNIVWATGQTAPNSPIQIRSYQTMGWDNARQYFYNALTTTDDAIRETDFAKTFQSIGQVMHLLQDMAVPAHVRNDFRSHLKFTGVHSFDVTQWYNNPFEYYVRNNPALIASSTPSTISISGALLTDFWDTDHRSGAPFEGLAETINANYFSDSTIPQNNPSIEHQFPSPLITSANYICTDKLPGSNKPTKYVSRTPCPTSGSLVDHFAAVSLLNSKSDSGSVSSIKKVWLDDNVHNTYATEPNGALAKAIGYSAALIDYFFRGTIELTLPAQGVYATAAPGGTFNEIRVKAKNTTASGEDMSNGTIQLVVKYNLSLADPYQSVLVDLGPDTYIVVPEKTSNLPDDQRIKRIPKGTETPVELTFDLSANPLPLWAANVTFQVLYKGQLGNKANSVAVGYNDIAEPTPIDVYNNTDYSCLNGSWYRYDDPAAMTIVDSNGDGIADREDIYPHNITNIAFLGGPANAGQLNATLSNNLFAPGPLQPGHALRLGYILTDYALRYTFNETRTGSSGDSFQHIALNENFSGQGFRNDWDIWNSMSRYRGEYMWGPSGVIFINRPYNGTCSFAALNQLLGY